MCLLDRNTAPGKSGRAFLIPTTCLKRSPWVLAPGKRSRLRLWSVDERPLLATLGYIWMLTS